MATNSELTSEAQLVELLGRERYDDYFNEAVGGDSTMGVGDISANVDIFDNACAIWPIQQWLPEDIKTSILSCRLSKL